jgi:hypothetical protein
MYVKFNASKMFGHREPWDCSNSQANLGSRAAELTWECAMEVASAHAEWLVTPLADAVDAIRDDAKGYGAWDENEIAAWSDGECLALFVQFVASDLRELGSDDDELGNLTGIENENVNTYLFAEGDTVLGERYLGV